MPVFLVEWEVSGFMAVEAETPEAAKRVAEDNWPDDSCYLSQHDVDFSSPMPIACIQEMAHRSFGLLNEDSVVYGSGVNGCYRSEKILKALLPDDPQWPGNHMKKFKTPTFF